MNIQKKTVGRYTLISEIIWGAVLIGCAFVLRGTEGYIKIQFILIGGILMHNALIWVPMLSLFKKRPNEE